MTTMNPCCSRSAVQSGLIVVLLVCMAWLPRTANSEEILDTESKEVAFCTGVLSYAINWGVRISPGAPGFGGAAGAAEPGQ